MINRWFDFYKHGTILKGSSNKYDLAPVPHHRNSQNFDYKALDLLHLKFNIEVYGKSM
jgi:hypothetical protein